MNRVRTRLPAFLVFLVSTAALAATAADVRAPESPVPVSGAYNVIFNVNLNSMPPAGATILCKARIAPNLAPLQNFSQKIVPAQSATGLATIANSAANCSVQIPFSWAIGDASNGVALSYEIEAVSASGSLPVHARQSIGVAYPARGGTANLAIDVRF